MQDSPQGALLPSSRVLRFVKGGGGRDAAVAARTASAARGHATPSQPEAIDCGEIRRTLSGAITDEQLILKIRDSASTAGAPPGRTSFATVTSRWMARIRSSRMGRTVPWPASRADCMAPQVDSVILRFRHPQDPRSAPRAQLDDLAVAHEVFDESVTAAGSRD